ncbi:hypothetical protein CL622_09190 [archaeon]|nr:hypothetical protein [archaeon]
MDSSNSIKNIRPLYSVTNRKKATEEEKGDLTKPFPLMLWLKYCQLQTQDPSEYIAQYNRYLKDWRKITGIVDASESYTVNSYKTALKEIALNYTTPEEKRYLGNINYNDPADLDIAIPFFAKKLKQVALYYANEREKVKQRKGKIGLIGSKQGLEHIIYNHVANHLVQEDFILTYNTSTINLNEDGFLLDYKVRIDELYDETTGYHDIDPVNETYTNVLSGRRKSLFTYEQFPYDPDIFIDFDKAIASVLKEHSTILQASSAFNLLGANNLVLTVDGESDINDVSNLDLHQFINYNKDKSELNIYTHKDIIPNLIGNDLLYLSAGSSSTYLSGSLTTASTPHRHIYNRKHPTVNFIPDNSNLKNIKQIGGYFLPDKLGSLTYFSYKPQPFVLTSKLVAGDVHVIPDFTKYGSGLGASNVSSSAPIDHKENVLWIKADQSNDSLYGDIINSSNLQKFYNYSSKEEVSLYPQFGVSRITDNFDFWKGDKRDIWANDDIYKLTSANTYNLSDRQEDLLVSHDTMYQWRGDIYGNEYSLYKTLKPLKSPDDEGLGFSDPDVIETACVLADAGASLKALAFDPATENLEYIDGGRHPGIDPQPEEKVTPTVWGPAIAGFGGKDYPAMWPAEENSTHEYYDGYTKEFKTTPAAYHGFMAFDHDGIRKEPTYDSQAFCGLFTPYDCGDVAGASLICAIADNYSFKVYDEDIYEKTLNELTDTVFDTLSTFNIEDNYPDVKVLEAAELDGYNFTTTHCEDADADFEYNVSTSPAFMADINIGQTEYTSTSNLITKAPTLYNQKTSVGGEVFFRNVNSSNIDNLSNAFKNVFEYYDDFSTSDLAIIKSQISNNEVINVDVINDILIVQTDGYILMEKINHDLNTITINANNTTNVVIKTTDSNSSLERPIRWFFNENRGDILVGKTVVDPVSGNVYPVIYNVNVDNLNMNQVFPVDNTDIYKYAVTGSLSSFDIEQIDDPIVSYDTYRDIYNVSYSLTLTNKGSSPLSSSSMIYGIFSNDYTYKRNKFRLIDCTLVYSGSASYYTDPGSIWEPSSKTTFFVPETASDAGTVNCSVTDTLGYAISSYEYELTLSPFNITLPTDRNVNRLIYDFGDGSDLVVKDRSILKGVEALDVPWEHLPNQGDFGDPRKYRVSHVYRFNKTTSHTYTAKVSAIYSDFTKLVYNVNIETHPYTVQSGLSSLKLINSKAFTDIAGKQKQLLTLESQNPRYVTNVLLDKSIE